nr:DUF3784 domain-containing protein [uncultured Blautia sp.]
MNMDSFDMILTVAALVMGVMLLAGRGDILLKGGNADARKKIYDEKKLQKVYGVTLILLGILTALDMVIKSYAYDIVYLVVVIVIFAISVVIVRKKCRK